MTSPYTPAYVEIAESLREQIRSGELAKGAKLPSERELTEQFGVSGITARSAVATLRNEGLVESIRGKGAFVRDVARLVRVAPERYFRPHHAPTYVQEAERAGISVETKHETAIVPAPDRVAERLLIDPGDEVTEVRYFITMGGAPVTMSTAWEPMALKRGTDIEMPHEGPYANQGMVTRWDAIGININEVHEIVVPRAPTPAEMRQMRIPQGVPVVEIHQTFRANGTPVEIADIVFPADRYELHFRMEIH